MSNTEKAKELEECKHEFLQVSFNGQYSICEKCRKVLSKHPGENEFTELRYQLPEQDLPQPENNIENAAFVKSIEHYGKVTRDNNDFVEGAKFGAKWQSQQPEVKQWVSEWISVKDRLPEESSYYLTWVKGFSRPIELYFNIETGSFATTDRSIINITDWQPLPKPPNSTTAHKTDKP